jgi:signal transduction histidine kinase
VPALADRTLRLLETVAQKRGVTLHLLAGPAPAADLDPAMMQQVLTNLVVNAVQATPAGGAVDVAVAAVAATPPQEHGGAPGTWLRVEVRDTGCGIEPENMRRLFEPFFTTKGVGEGTGLGLSVSRGIVREHGGWIDAQSAPGRGSCFAVHLPLPAKGVGDAG